MTSPTPRSSGLDANARGLVVLAVAVVIGLLLLLKAGDTGGTTKVATGGTTTTIDISGIGNDSTTTTPDDTTTSSSTPTATTRAPADVKVLVLNGSGLTGVAKSTSARIGEKGYTMVDPTNANTKPATTVVYYADGYQAEAADVAAVLGKSSDAVEALPSTSPGPGADKANVVVVLGKDTPPASSSSSSSSTSSTSTTTSN